jgi:hypothetical protein
MLAICFALALCSTFVRADADCDEYGPAQPRIDVITTNSSEIRDNKVYIQVDFPAYVKEKNIWVKGNDTLFRYVEGETDGGWEEGDNGMCYENLNRLLIFEDLKSSEIIVTNNTMYFWLDFSWTETANHKWFGEVSREFSIDLPFMLDLAPDRSIVVALSTSHDYHPPTVSPTNPPSTMPTDTRYCDAFVCPLGQQQIEDAADTAGHTKEDCCETIVTEYTLVGYGSCESHHDDAFNKFSTEAGESSAEEAKNLCSSLGTACLGYSHSSSGSAVFLATKNDTIGSFGGLTETPEVFEQTSECGEECGLIDDFAWGSGVDACWIKSTCWVYTGNAFGCEHNYCEHGGSGCEPREDMAACAASDCNNHGTAYGEDANHGCFCVCDEGWSGDSCNENESCAAEDCNHHGTASGNVLTGCTCDCNEDWTGDNCTDHLINGWRLHLRMSLDDLTDQTKFQIKDCFAEELQDDTRDLELGTISNSSLWFNSRRFLEDEKEQCLTLREAYETVVSIFDQEGGVVMKVDQYVEDVTEKNTMIDRAHGVDFENDVTSCVNDELGTNYHRIVIELIEACDAEIHCSGNGYTIDLDNGDGCECVCDSAWEGDDCSEIRKCSAETDCNGHGTTDDEDATDGCECHCEETWQGHACEEPRPCNQLDCSLHGNTTDTDATDSCLCDCEFNWIGDACETPRPCDRKIDCTNNGNTTDIDATDGCVCECDFPWYGDACEIQPPTVMPTHLPTVMPTEEPSSIPSLSPSTSKPTDIPTSLPSVDPTVMPTDHPSAFPTESPIDDAFVVWMINAIASEISIDDEPWIEVEFTTATSHPWTLDYENATSEYIVELHEFEKTEQWDCGNVNGRKSLCQTFSMKFTTKPDCDSARRDILITFLAEYTNSNSHQQVKKVTLPIEISGSSAFQCAENIGTFEIATETWLSLDGDDFVAPSNISEVVIGEDLYLKVAFSSGTNNIETVGVEDILISTSSIPYNMRCTDCQDNANINFTVIDDSHSEFTFKITFAEEIFNEPQAVTIRFNFYVTYQLRRYLVEFSASDLLSSRAITQAISIILNESNDPTTTSVPSIIQSTEESEVEAKIVEPSAASVGGDEESSFVIILVISVVLLVFLGSCGIYQKCRSRPSSEVSERSA